MQAHKNGEEGEQHESANSDDRPHRKPAKTADAVTGCAATAQPSAEPNYETARNYHRQRGIKWGHWCVREGMEQEGSGRQADYKSNSPLVSGRCPHTLHEDASDTCNATEQHHHQDGSDADEESTEQGYNEWMEWCHVCLIIRSRGDCTLEPCKSSSTALARVWLKRGLR